MDNPCGSPAQPDQPILQLEAFQAVSELMSNCEGPLEPLGTIGRQESSLWSDSRLGGSGLVLGLMWATWPGQPEQGKREVLVPASPGKATLDFASQMAFRGEEGKLCIKDCMQGGHHPRGCLSRFSNTGVPRAC